MESMDQFIGTKAVSERHAFDVGALERHLQRELPGFAGPLTVEQFKGGQSNPTYKLITPQRTYAMRSKPGPAAKLLPSAHAIEREFRVMQRAGAHRRAGGADAPAVRRRVGDRPRVLRDGVRRRPRVVGAVAARLHAAKGAPRSTTR